MSGLVAGASFSPRWFLYLGFALVVLAVAIFPTRIPIQAQPGDVDYMSIGWLFTPIIGVYGLASMVIGLVHSSYPKRKIEFYLVAPLAVVSGGLAYAAILAIVFGSGIIRSMGNGEPFFWLYFLLVLIPGALIYASAVKFLRSGKNFAFMATRRAQLGLFFTLAVVPLLYTGIFLLMMFWAQTMTYMIL